MLVIAVIKVLVFGHVLFLEDMKKKTVQSGVSWVLCIVFVCLSKSGGVQRCFFTILG